MKKIMLSTISWSDYAFTVSIVFVLWYLYLIFRYYKVQIKDILTGKRKIGYSKKGSLNEDLFGEFREPFDTLEDARELSEKLIKAIEESEQRDLSPTEFKNYLRFILAEYPFVKISSLRDKINNLIVSECEKHPRLILTNGEVHELWEETI